MTAPRYYPQYHSRQFDSEGRGLDCYTVIDSYTSTPVTPPLPYHAANDYAAARNNPHTTEEPTPASENIANLTATP